MIRRYGDQTTFMNNSLHSDDNVDLSQYPSAQEQLAMPDELVSMSASRSSRLLKVIASSLLGVFILAAVAAGIVYYVLTAGPISNNQIRAQVESQLSTFLGDNYSARVGAAQVAFGHGGLFSIDAQNVRLLEKNQINLGVLGNVGVNLKLLPMLRGKYIAEKLSISNAIISLDPLLSKSFSSKIEKWPAALDFPGWMAGLAGWMTELSENVDQAGLEKITMINTKLIGFDKIGLRSQSARLVELKLEVDPRFQSGMFLSAIIEAEFANWEISGKWVPNDDDGRDFKLSVEGFDLREFVGNTVPEMGDVFYVDSPVKLDVSFPYSKTGRPLAASIGLQLEQGLLKLGKDHASEISGAQLNFKIMPDENQIELEASPVSFPSVRAMLIGGVKYPLSGTQDAEQSRPIFELIANDVVSSAMENKNRAARGAIKINGWIDAVSKTLNATEVSLQSETGEVRGRGRIGFSGETPSLALDLKVKKVSINEMKQLWPPFLATGARNWAKAGIKGGVVRNGWVSADIPAGILGNLDAGKKMLKKHITAHLPIKGARIGLPKGLPVITNASGVVNYSGMATSISVDAGETKLGKGKNISFSGGGVEIGDYSLKTIPSTVTLKLKGSASAFAQLGTFESLGYASELGVNPNALSGAVSGEVKLKFGIEDGGKISGLGWNANLKVSELSAKVPLRGYKINDAKLTVKAKPGEARVNGTTNLDGIPTTLAMILHFGKNQKRDSSSITLSLDEKARRKLGVDTGGIVTGVVDVTVTDGANGIQHVDADFRRAKLSFPWIEWSKGKGISATASFDMKRGKKLLKINKLKLRGDGFSAGGELTVDSAGLVSANMRNIRLNRSDDFDVIAKRVRNGLDVKVKARSYDGRAIIRSFLDSNDSGASSKAQLRVSISAQVDRLTGFDKQYLNGVSLNYVQNKGKVVRADARAVVQGNAPLIFKMKPTKSGMNTLLQTNNAGSVLRFLDIYTKMEGGVINVDLVRRNSKFFHGSIKANNFYLLDEPRLAKLLAPPSKIRTSDDDSRSTLSKVSKVDHRRAKIKSASVNVKMGKRYLKVSQGRMRGGDAGAAFKGVVYDQNDRMKIKGTFLPAYGLNKFVSKIPILGLALGRGKKRGLIGITFKLSGPYKKPVLVVNPISLLTPGVFRKIFEY